MVSRQGHPAGVTYWLTRQVSEDRHTAILLTVLAGEELPSNSGS